MKRITVSCLMCGNTKVIASILLVLTLSGFQSDNLRSGDPALQEWILTDPPESASDDSRIQWRVAVGKMLFFDPRLSGDGSISCASCHNPMLGWSNGLATGVGFQGQILRRASPSLINSAYNSVYNWDGSARTLEQQALGPLLAPLEMHSDIDTIIDWLMATPGYASVFQRAFPEEGISATTITKAIAAFQRTIISNDSPFDRWIQGDSDAMSSQEIRGFEIFLREDKGNCSTCHSAPNFTDNSFHNIGLESQLRPDPDLGRFEIIPIAVLKGAFKTPTLRDINQTAPYFHDGSAETLEEVVEHYVQGGDVEENLSPDMKPLDLTEREKNDLVSFLHALSTPPRKFEMPVLPVSLVQPDKARQHNADNNEAVLVGIDE